MPRRFRNRIDQLRWALSKHKRWSTWDELIKVRAKKGLTTPPLPSRRTREPVEQDETRAEADRRRREWRLERAWLRE